MRNSKLFVQSAGIALVTGLLASPALAQASKDEAGNGDIVVTAQKREQNLQQVPISISAITGAQAEVQGLTEVKNISAIAPNVTVLGGTTNAAAAVVSIRGIPTPADETQGFDSPIGLYLDGVYLARSSTASFEVADIERIEVLRGPQGTLFGRNTTGGAVNFITRDPAPEAGAKFKAGYGNYNSWMMRASLDTGGDKIRATISGLYKKRNGVVDNLLQPDKSLDPGGYQTSGFRVAVRAELADNVTVRDIFDYTRTKGVPMPQQLAAVGNGVANPTVFFPGFTNVTPAPVAQYLAQSSILEAAQGCGKTASLTRVDPICLEAARPSTDEVYGNLLRIELDLDKVTVRSSTAFRWWHNRIEGSDLDGMGTIRGAALGPSSTTLNGFPAAVLGVFQPAGTAAFLASQPVFSANVSLFQADNTRSQKQFSQEIEVVSKNDGGFNWVLGGFYFKEQGDEFNNQNFGFVLDTNQAVFNSTNFGALAPLLQANNPARYRVSLQQSSLGYHASGSSFAIYGQGEYRPGGKDGAFGITLGLRYTWDSKAMRVFQNGATAFTDPALIALNDQKAKFHDWTGNLTLDYRATEDINLYARVARGYRSGGFNARQTTNLAANLGLVPFKNENIWSYEAGIKAKIGNVFRFNASVFMNDYSNLQLAVPIPITGGGSFGTRIDNAGKVRYTGFEVEAQWRPNETIWFDGNVGYTHKKFREYNTLNSANQPANIASVVHANYSPDWTAAIAANVRVPLGGDAHATGRLGYTYTSDYYQFGNPITAPFMNETKGDSRGLIDAQLRFDGFKIGDTVKDVALTIWAKNLGNKSYIMRSVDFGALGFAGTIYGEPRTFGATIEFAF